MKTFLMMLLAFGLVSSAGFSYAGDLDFEEGWEKLFCYPLKVREFFIYHEGKVTNHHYEKDRDMEVFLNRKEGKIVINTYDEKDQTTEFTITNIESNGWTNISGYAENHRYKQQGVSEIIHLSLRHDKKDPKIEGVTAILYRASTSLFGVEAEVTQCIYFKK